MTTTPDPADVWPELKPCPFCGGKPCNPDETAFGLQEKVYCTDCFASGPRRKWRADAHSSWNTRAVITPPPPEIA